MCRILKRFWTPYLSGRDCSNTWDPGCRFACPGLGAFGLSARALSAKKHAEKIVDFEHPTCKGKSFNPLCYSYLIADLAYVYFVQQLRHVLKLLPLQGATAPTRDTQGVASLALGYVLHWAFSPPLLNPRPELLTLKMGQIIFSLLK